MHTAMAAGALFLSAAAVMAQTGFTDHGVGTPLAERRGVVATRDANGKYVAVACSTDLSPRRWLLVTDIDSGDTTQVWCPEGVPTEGPYGSLLASNGRFYTGAGRTLLEFDVTARDWTFHGIPVPGASAYLRLIEGPDGLIYGTAGGKGRGQMSEMFVYDRQDKKFTFVCPMRDEERQMDSVTPHCMTVPEAPDSLYAPAAEDDQSKRPRLSRPRGARGQARPGGTGAPHSGHVPGRSVP